MCVCNLQWLQHHHSVQSQGPSLTKITSTNKPTTKTKAKPIPKIAAIGPIPKSLSQTLHLCLYPHIAMHQIPVPPPPPPPPKTPAFTLSVPQSPSFQSTSRAADRPGSFPSFTWVGPKPHWAFATPL